MKIKKIISVYECPDCGSTNTSERHIIIDELSERKIELPKEYCSCGRKGKQKLIDIKIEDKKD